MSRVWLIRAYHCHRLRHISPVIFSAQDFHKDNFCMTRRFLFVVYWFSLMSFAGMALRGTIYAQDGGEANEMKLLVAMTPPDSLDPLRISRFDYEKRDLIEALFIGLTRFDARRGEIVPWLATSWETAPDGLTWRFSLRDDVMWMQYTNDEAVALRPVVASDVVFAVQRACDPRRASPVTTNLVIIAGCKDMLGRTDTWAITQTMMDETIGVRAVDETTVEFNLLFPAAYFLTLTSLPEFRPLPAELVQGETYPQEVNLATSGPWVVTAWDGQHMVLNTNPTWPIPREGNVNTVEIRFDLSADTLSNRLTNGTIDLARVSLSTAQTVRLSNPDAVFSGTDRPLYMVGFSYEQGIVVDARVREALALAIDREQLAQAVNVATGEDFMASGRFTPRDVIGTSTAPGVGFEPARAQQRLAEAGYPQCANFPVRLTLAVANDPQTIAIGQNLVQQWTQHLGCAEGTFELAVISRQALIDNAHATLPAEEVARYAMWLVSWTDDYPDANAWLADALHCQFGVLRVGRACNVNDVVLDQAGVTNDVLQRSTAYTQVENAFLGANGEFPVVPLVIARQYWVAQTWVEAVPRYGAFQFDRLTVLDHTPFTDNQ
jgi:oligopeptide transport system substrate-binding protein